MLLTLLVGLLGAFVLTLAISAVVLAFDEEPTQRNLRQIRELAAFAASRSETREHPARDALLDASALLAEPARRALPAIAVTPDSRSPLRFAARMR